MVPFAVLSRTNSLRRAANSFRIRFYANRPILHNFGANKSFRFRSYRHPARNPFTIRSYENTGGGGGVSLIILSFDPALCLYAVACPDAAGAAKGLRICTILVHP
jgi:hypothetical protein